ncbi:jg16818 [Pararge aegeria aegeria]|uniref:Jg16818 protein n=1 Tax=Pararge aegeria aegeria TaxID=348720 RepID=A0A8S4SDX9_9NEOP|nr:jg16818 [Pararge aegeria aegeria]
MPIHRIDPLPAHYRAWVSSNKTGLVQIGRLHVPSEHYVELSVRHAGFLTMFSSTVQASDIFNDLKKLEMRAGIRTGPPESEAELLPNAQSPFQ